MRGLARGRDADAAASHLDAAALAATLQPGDVVFIGSDHALWGQVGALAMGDGGPYAHVGIAVAGPDGGILIAHAGGSPTNPDAEVAAAPVAQFLGRAERAGVHRPSGLAETARRAAAERALAYAEGGALFDAAFSLETEDRLYCTELVWRALSYAADADAVPDKTRRGGRVFIALDDLRAAPLLVEHAVFGDAR